MSDTDTGVGISLRFIVFSCLHPAIRRTESAVSESTLIPDFISVAFYLFLLILFVALLIHNGDNRLILFKVIKGQDLDIKKLDLIVYDGLSV